VSLLPFSGKAIRYKLLKIVRLCCKAERCRATLKHRGWQDTISWGVRHLKFVTFGGYKYYFVQEP